MQRGKISEITLKRSVLKNVNSRNEKVLGGNSVGLDASAIDLEGITVVMSSNIIESYFEGCIEYYINKTLNNIYVKGAKPIAVQVAITMPTESGEQELGKLMREINSVCNKLGMSICGGHTAVSENVTNPIVVFTIIGKTCYNVTDLYDVKPGQQIVMTKSIALGGTGVISHLEKNKLSERFTPGFVEKCEDFINHISVKKECEIALANGAVALHDISTGGAFAGFWEITTPTGYGVEIMQNNIPVWQEAIEVAEIFDINPYVLDGTGSLLIVTENGESMVEKLEAEGINAAVVGVITQGKDRVIINAEEKRYLEPQRGDELYKFI